MDTLKNMMGGGGGTSQQQQPQQQQGGGGGGGWSDKLNTLAGGGRESEKKEDALDKGLFFFLNHPSYYTISVLTQAKQASISCRSESSARDRRITRARSSRRRTSRSAIVMCPFLSSCVGV